jgi:hypothetical protein
MRLISSVLFAAGTIATLAFGLQAAGAQQRVCKEVCNAGVCRSECVETQGRREDRIEERRERRDERDRSPGLELRAPGVGVEIGKPGVDIEIGK